MLIPEKLNTLIRILLVNSLEQAPNMTILSLARKAGITSAMTKRLVLRLEKSGYVSIRRGVKVIDPIKLIRAWGYCYSIREIENSQFKAAERPQYIMMKLVNRARPIGLPYAFTLFSATEHISPYVAPSGTYLYILKQDLKNWQNICQQENIIPAEREGNVTFFLVDEEYFEGVWDVRGVKTVSLPQLYADLFSFGVRGEEAAEEIMKIIRPRFKNV